jgi:hypothetical protein
MISRLIGAVLLACCLTACEATTTSSLPGTPGSLSRVNPQTPPYAQRPYAPFTRDAAVQIALREWRAFGQKIVLSPNQLEDPDSKERDEGLWQRVGDYWWQGLDYGETEGHWTGKHDASGAEFPRGDDGNFAWSAAFIDYVMRMAGAGNRFPYAISHSGYINAARISGGYVVTALPLTQYPPQLGDIICMWRAGHPVSYEDLPAGHFPGHCDIVVAQHPGVLDVVGGNVDNAVSLKHVPVGPNGLMTGPTGAVIDTDYPWFVVLRVNYQAAPVPAAPVASATSRSRPEPIRN